MSRQEASEAVERQQGRKWFTGDVYSLHDLGPREGAKWTRFAGKPARDVFEMIGTDPRKHYKVSSIPMTPVSRTVEGCTC
jgi:small subunit ribosomal protein S18